MLVHFAFVEDEAKTHWNIYLIKNTPGVKKERPRIKTGLAEKDVKSNGWPVPPGFDRFKVFVMMNSLQNIVISGVLKAS